MKLNLSKPKPNPSQIANLRAWVGELRSGRWKQGRGSLAPTSCTRCCLGVACEILQETAHPDRAYLDLDFAMKLGIFNVGLSQSQLVRLNDVEYKTFPEIAGFIQSALDATLNNPSEACC